MIRIQNTNWFGSPDHPFGSWRTEQLIKTYSASFDLKFCYAPPLTGVGIKRWCCLTSIYLTSVYLTSVAYIGPKSRTERPRKWKKLAQSHICDSDTTFNVTRSKVKVTRPLYSSPCWRVRQLQWWAWERVGRGKLLLRCRLLGGARRFSANGEERGGGISWRPPAYSLFIWCCDGGLYRILGTGAIQVERLAAELSGMLILTGW